MGILTEARRHSLPAAVFGLPKLRKYPMPDMAHAANAKSRASAQYNIGALGAAPFHAIMAKANRKLGE